MKILNKTVLVCLLSVWTIACGGNQPTANSNTGNPTTNTATTTNSATSNNTSVANSTNTANSANTAANKTANTVTAKPAESGPKRVSFAAGKSEGTESVSLAPGESKQFVVGAKNGQIFMAEADSKDLEITMFKGKDTAQMKEPGHYDSTLLADGDFVFQVKNPTKKEVKSSIKIIISHTDISK